MSDESEFDCEEIDRILTEKIKRQDSALFIDNLSLDASYNSISRLFEPFGSIEDLTIKKGHAFLKFSDIVDVEEVIKYGNGCYFLGQKIAVKRCHFKEQCFYLEQSGTLSGDCSDNLMKKEEASQGFSLGFQDDEDVFSKKKIDPMQIEIEAKKSTKGQIFEPDSLLFLGDRKVYPSDEQRDIIEASKEDNVNIIINCAAGSGKTTTALFIAKANAKRRVLLLTYNARLKSDTRIRIKNERMSNLECHSYHSFYVKYFFHKAYTDTGIGEVLRNQMKPSRSFNYDVIILDEIQDCSFRYYEAVLYLVSFMQALPKIIVLGDSRQNIFEFNGANKLFLEEARVAWNFDTFSEFKTFPLKVSYRITKKIAGFINKCLADSDVLHAVKDGDKVRYMIINLYKDSFKEVEYYINKLNGDLENIFILAPSIKREKKRNPVNFLVDELTKRNIKIFVPPSDDDFIADDSELKGKIAILSFHQAKGLERDAVIVFGFDNSYFEFHCKDSDTKELPNPIYVGLTRARKYLSVLHGDSKPFLECLKKKSLPEWCDIHGIYSGKTNVGRRIRSIPKTVTNLLRHIPNEFIENSVGKLKISELRKGGLGDFYTLKTLIPGDNNTKEGVAEINSILVPAFFELKNTGKMTIIQILREKYDKESLQLGKSFKEMINKSWKNKINYDVQERMILENDPNPILEEIYKKNCTFLLLNIATIYQGFRSGFTHKNNQIQKYDWISVAELHDLVWRLEQNLKVLKGLKFELVLASDFPRAKLQDFAYVLSGVADIVVEEKKQIWEIKCCSETSPLHFLQLALYIHLYFKDYGRKYKGMLYNVITNDLYEVDADSIILEGITLELLGYHNNVKHTLPNTQNNEFFSTCLAIREKYSLPPRSRQGGSSMDLE